MIEPEEEERRNGIPGRRVSDRQAAETLDQVGRLAALAGARVEALTETTEAVTGLRASVEVLASSIARMATKEEVEERVADERDARRRGWIVAGVLALVVLLAVSALLVALLLVAGQNRENGRLLVECTTPGTRVPTPDDPRTGNPCFDRQQSAAAKFLAQIIDTDGNGVADQIELRCLIQTAHDLPESPQCERLNR